MTGIHELSHTVVVLPRSLDLPMGIVCDISLVFVRVGAGSGNVLQVRRHSNRNLSGVSIIQIRKLIRSPDYK